MKLDIHSQFRDQSNNAGEYYFKTKKDLSESKVYTGYESGNVYDGRPGLESAESSYNVLERRQNAVVCAELNSLPQRFERQARPHRHYLYHLR